MAAQTQKQVKHLSQDLSDALRDRRWSDAKSLLAALSRADAGAVKLGSLQRWTRDADACVDDDEATARSRLWLLCRLAAGGGAAAAPADAPIRRAIFSAAPRAEALQPTPTAAADRRAAYVCAREKVYFPAVSSTGVTRGILWAV